MIKKIIAIAIAIIVIVSVYFIMTTTDGYEETPWDDDELDGNWGQQIVFVYEDGTSSLSFYDGDKEIVGMYYYLDCKAVSDEQDYVDLDFSNYYYKITTTRGTTTYFDVVNYPWRIEANKWKILLLTPEMLTAFGSTDVVYIITNYLSVDVNTIDEFVVFQENADGSWDSWSNNRPSTFNSLTTFTPGCNTWWLSSSDCYFDVDFRLLTDGQWKSFVGTYHEVVEILPEDYSRVLAKGNNEGLRFPKEIWTYNSALRADNSVNTFCQQGGIWDYMDSIYRTNGAEVVWVKGSSSSTLTTIDSVVSHPEYMYSFITTGKCEIYIDFDLLPEGDYEISISSGGTIKYRPEGENWLTAVLPEDLTLIVTREEGQSLQIAFEHFVGT